MRHEKTIDLFPQQKTDSRSLYSFQLFVYKTSVVTFLIELERSQVHFWISFSDI